MLWSLSILFLSVPHNIIPHAMKSCNCFITFHFSLCPRIDMYPIYYCKIYCNKMSPYNFQVTISEYVLLKKYAVNMMFYRGKLWKKYHGISHIPKNRSQVYNKMFYRRKLCHMRKCGTVWDKLVLYNSKNTNVEKWKNM
jgi:hypothetical protein